MLRGVLQSFNKENEFDFKDFIVSHKARRSHLIAFSYVRFLRVCLNIGLKLYFELIMYF